MKKNRFIKLASGLLVLCLMTTCVIGATLAKYTTAGSGADTARVAKWGVTVSASGSLLARLMLPTAQVLMLMKLWHRLLMYFQVILQMSLHPELKTQQV